MLVLLTTYNHIYAAMRQPWKSEKQGAITRMRQRKSGKQGAQAGRGPDLKTQKARGWMAQESLKRPKIHTQNA